MTQFPPYNAPDQAHTLRDPVLFDGSARSRVLLAVPHYIPLGG